MKIRIIFECSGCGSTFYRPSSKLTFKDNFLRKFGIRPQRCYRCRRRFYVFRPALVNLILRVIATPTARPAPQQPQIALSPQPPEIARAPKAAPVAHSWTAPPDRTAPPVKTDVVWSTFAEADQRKSGS
jgi:hypothetical protein